MKKIIFPDDSLPYSIVAESKRYAVCTRPIDRKEDKDLIKRLTDEDIRTCVIYTLVDFVDEIRSTNNRIFNSYDYSKVEDCKKCLEDLESGVVELSRRNKVPLTKITVFDE